MEGYRNFILQAYEIINPFSECCIFEHLFSKINYFFIKSVLCRVARAGTRISQSMKVAPKCSIGLYNQNALFKEINNVLHVILEFIFQILYIN